MRRSARLLGLLCSAFLAQPVQAQVAAVGTIEGAFEVDSRGNATYQIPLAVPPGRVGLTPELTLEYSASLGNGPVGYGWAIGGVPAIARCPQNPVDDQGGVDPVDLDGNDQFCLNGSRLILKSGTHGENGAEYRTKIDGYSFIRYFKSATHDYFVVLERNSSVLFFGRTSSDPGELARAPVFANGVTAHWSLRSIGDRSGNSILYHYDAGLEGGVLYSRLESIGSGRSATTPNTRMR